MWETAERAGVITANLMWPGPPKTTSGASSTYFVPWKVCTLRVKLVDAPILYESQDKVPLGQKLDQLMKWIDLPFDKRPQFLMGMFTTISYRVEN